jgi:hypothetical protein
MCNTAVFFGEELAKYGFGKSHPLNEDRIYAFWSKFTALELDKSTQIRIEKPDSVMIKIMLNSSRKLQNTELVFSIWATLLHLKVFSKLLAMWLVQVSKHWI